MGEPNNPDAGRSVSKRNEIWAIKLLVRVFQWFGITGWEARAVRTYLVYQEHLRDAFETFDIGDYTAAFVLFKRHADTGSAVAQHNIGVLYEAGYGTPRSDEEAEKYYRLASEQGLPEAQYGLGLILAADVVTGDFNTDLVLIGDPHKAIEGYKWLYIAKLRGNRDASPALRRLKKAMPRDAIDAAELAALDWQAEHMHRGRIRTRTARKSGARQGFRRLAIVLGATGALFMIGVPIMGVLYHGEGPLAGDLALADLLRLTALAAGAFVALWLPVRVIGWIFAGFFENNPS